MKKQLILISLILAVFTGFAQETDTKASSDTVGVDSICHHRILIHMGAGGTNNIYRRIPEVKQIYSMGSNIEIGYSYLWDTKSGLWGLGIGVGIQHTVAKANLNFNGVVYNAGDPDDYNQASSTNTNYDLYYGTKGLIEKQTNWAIEVPLTAQYETKFDGRNGIYAKLGVKGYFPIKSKSVVNDGTLKTWGYDEWYDAVYVEEHCVDHGFQTSNIQGSRAFNKLRCSVDLQADFGGIFTINNKVDFYVGLYCSYGFLDILPAEKNRHPFIENADNLANLKYNGLLGSNYLVDHDRAAIQNGTDVIGNLKWNHLQAGVKVGINIKPCGQVDESARKKFYKKMTEAAQKYLDDTCSTCDKNVQYVYIVPVSDEEGGKKMTKKEKKAAEELAEALENIKILFDLDKDVPKINEEGDWIDKAVKLLKENESFGLRIEGYTCPLGPEEHNRDLAIRRAESIKRMFVEKGVNPEQLETVTYTAKDPENAENIKDTSNEEHRAAILHIIKR